MGYLTTQNEIILSDARKNINSSGKIFLKPEKKTPKMVRTSGVYGL